MGVGSFFTRLPLRRLRGLGFVFVCVYIVLDMFEVDFGAVPRRVVLVVVLDLEQLVVIKARQVCLYTKQQLAKQTGSCCTDYACAVQWLCALVDALTFPSA